MIDGLPDRILIIKPSSLGDIVHAIPAVRRLRLAFPNARMDWLVATSFAPILEEWKDLSGLVLFDRRRYRRIFWDPRTLAAFFTWIRRLRAQRYDMVIDLQGLLRSGLITWLSGAPVRMGFASAREGARLFYSKVIAVPDADPHAVDRNQAFVEAILQQFRLSSVGERPREPSNSGFPFSLVLTDEERNAAGRRLRARTPRAARRIAVFPGARWETKRWSPDSFAAVINELQSDADVTCILLGSPEDRLIGDRILAACERSPVNWIGRTGLREMAALLEACDGVLSLDSAPVHLAAALEKPLVCLMGPTDPGRTGPYRRSEDVVRLPLACSPCFLRRLSQCRYGHRCMKELDPKVVAERVRASLGCGSL